MQTHEIVEFCAVCLQLLMLPSHPLNLSFILITLSVDDSCSINDMQILTLSNILRVIKTMVSIGKVNCSVCQ
jgi:hypothetical protein